MKLSQCWRQVLLHLALIGAVLALCFLWGGMVASVSAESTALVGSIHASSSTGSAHFMVNGITLSGPAVSLRPASVNFGHQEVHTTAVVRTITLTNSGDTPLTINGIGLSGPNRGDFAQKNTCPSGTSTLLATGASCFINVTFTPTATGSRSASVTIADNASGNPQSVALSGSGVSTSATAVTLSPTSVIFEDQQAHTTSAARTITLTNSSGDPLTINSIGLSGTNISDFAQHHSCPTGSSTLLAPGGSCTINVTFTPTATGSRSATVTITYNASGSPQSVALSGTGVLDMPSTGSDPNAPPPVDNTLLPGWLALLVAIVAATGLGTALVTGRPRRSGPR